MKNTAHNHFQRERGHFYSGVELLFLLLLVTDALLQRRSDRLQNLMTVNIDTRALLSNDVIMKIALPVM